MKVVDFQATPRRCGTISRKHTSPAFQPPLPPPEAGALAQAAEQHAQAAAPEPGALGAALFSAAAAEHVPSQGSEDSR